MKKTEEKGITLIALVITIVLLLILGSIGVNSGTKTIKLAQFSQFENELKILQNKVNELNEKGEQDIGQSLTNEQNQILENSTISDIIYKGKTDEEKNLIKAGFKYCNNEYIKNNLNLEGIKRGYLINVEYRYIIYPDGFEYKDTTYYMLNQIDDGYYNVDYNDKNSKTGKFDVNYTQENDRWKIEITNIEYEGYISNWKVKYKLSGSSYWETSNNLTFYINEPGKYIFNVQHGNEVDLGEKELEIFKSPNTADGSWNGYVNTPNLKNTGLIPVYWDEGTSQWRELTNKSTQIQWESWYNYSTDDNKKWANAKSKDGSMWVWIPRYEYKIDSANKSIDVRFISTNIKKGTEGYDVDTSTGIISSSDNYIIHPAFINDTENSYSNGGWSSELSGFWVAKYAAGYQNGTIGETAKTVTYSDLKYTSINNGSETYESNFLTDSLSTNTNISYPVFKANTYTYNIICVGDAFLLSQEIDGKNSLGNTVTNASNFYGLNNIDSHLEKNSEWGAVAYLTHSQYGVNGNSNNMNEVVINSKNLDNSIYVNNAVSGTLAYVYAITSYGNNNTPNDISASSTKNITGVFDLNGCVWEMTAGYYKGGESTGTGTTTIWHSDMATSSTLNSTKYVTLYENNNKQGDATNETSGWNSDNSNFITASAPVFRRGGYYVSENSAGIFAFASYSCNPYFHMGFRVVLVNN